MKEVLEVSDISKEYDDFELERLSFSLKSGELFGFLGPNGSGKTTLTKILTGQILPSAGKAKVLGVDPIEDPIGVRGKIGIIPEQENPPSFLTVQEYLEFIVKIRDIKDGQKKIEWWLDFMEFEKNRNHLIKDLSRGTKQKVLVVQAFIHQPQLVFIDEPLINLDPVMQKKFKDYLKDYIKKGNTIFLSTHVLSIADEICTSIGIIRHGKLLYQGDMKDIKKKHKNLENYFISVVGKK